MSTLKNFTRAFAYFTSSISRIDNVHFQNVESKKAFGKRLMKYNRNEKTLIDPHLFGHNIIQQNLAHEKIAGGMLYTFRKTHVKNTE